MQPSIGRIVHYRSYGTPGGEYLPEPRAAVITEIDEKTEHIPVPSVGLCVMNPEGLFFNRNVPFADVPAPGHWNWPPRVSDG